MSLPGSVHAGVWSDYSPAVATQRRVANAARRIKLAKAKTNG